LSESEVPFDIDHVDHSIGGFGGHAFRRATHVSMSAIPVIYYSSGEQLGDYFSLSPRELVSVIVISILLIELIRLRWGIVVIGQREYESSQISAFAWGGIAVALALLVAPEGDGSGIEKGLFGIPLIFGLTFVDPVMGEVKRTKKDLKSAIVAGALVSFTVWVGCHFWLGTPLIASLLLAPLTVLGELPSLKYIDDNATMVLIPLAALVIMSPFL
tara:strand:+ start:4697 stop:5341 length:645 start_codon:yes stop_codon:yes gene_type:complete